MDPIKLRTKSKWCPDTYHKLALAQEFAATNLIEKLNISSRSKILDVGCGDGKITAILSNTANEGLVLGIDTSEDMIRFAKGQLQKNHSRQISFKIENAENISYSNEFNLVFSSFCMQWIKNKSAFLAKVFKALKTSGKFAFIVPLCVSVEFEDAISEVIKQPSWSKYFHRFKPGWYFSSSRQLRHLTEEQGFIIRDYTEFTQIAVFNNIRDFSDYVSLWFPYFDRLDQSMHKDFFESVLSNYLEKVPARSDGSIEMRIPILEIIAEKSNPLMQ